MLSIHEELASGTFLHDKAEAFIIKSFTDNLMLSFDRISLNSLRNLQEEKNGVSRKQLYVNIKLEIDNKTLFMLCLWSFFEIYTCIW